MNGMEQLATEGKKPRYVLTYERLYQMIMAGSFPLGKLPAEPKLAEMLNVSRMTLRQAIALLRDDGLINNIQGKGNFITAAPKHHQIGGLERVGNPVHRCCTTEIDAIEVESRIDFPNDYMIEVLERRTTAVVVFHRWYKHAEQYIGYSISFIPVETLTAFEIDTAQQDRITEFLEEGIYAAAQRADLEIHLSETGEFISEKHMISKKKTLNMIVERLYGEVKIPLLVNKHYLTTECCAMVIHAQALGVAISTV